MNWRDLTKKRALIYGTGSAVSVVLVLGILIFAGLLSNRFSVRWDLTRNQSQSLTAITKALLSQVKGPLSLTVFSPEGQGDRQNIRELLQTYAYNNSLVSYHFVDPDREPLRAKEAGYRFPGNTLLEYQGRRQMAERPDEEAITEALRKVLKTERKKVYFLTGHGERGLEDGKREGFTTVRKALENEGFEPLDLNLLKQAEVPKDAAVLVVAGPQKPLFPNEVTALKAYLNRGGRLLVMLAPFEDGGLKDLLATYGVGLDDSMILDQNQMSQALGANAVMPLVVKYGPHRITQNFTNVVTIFPLARPLSLSQGVKDVSMLPLAMTTETSWAKMGKDWLKEGKGDFDAKKDRKGPFTLAALAEIKLPGEAPGQSQKGGQPQKADAGKPGEPEGKAELAVYGDVDFADNTYFNLSGNGDLFLNTLNFLAQEEKQIIIRREAGGAQPLLLSPMQGWVLLLVSFVALPLGMLGAGVATYLRRRASR